jgi:hypothetical protein
MTIVAAVRKGDSVRIGWDQRGITRDRQLTVYSREDDAKVVQHGPVCIGFCGRFGIIQAIEYGLDKFDFDAGRGLYHTAAKSWLYKQLRPAIREVLKAEGFTDFDPKDCQEYLLIAWETHLFVIWPGDWQIRTCNGGFDAIGSGEAHAVSSLETSAITGELAANPDRSLKIALEVAERRGAGVKGPFHFCETSV